MEQPYDNFLSTQDTASLFDDAWGKFTSDKISWTVPESDNITASDSSSLDICRTADFTQKPSIKRMGPVHIVQESSRSLTHAFTTPIAKVGSYIATCSDSSSTDIS